MDLFALEARLKLNTDDYTLGLEEAEAQAREMVEASENAAEGANALSEAMSSQAGEIGEAEGAAQELADVYHEIGDAADGAWTSVDAGAGALTEMSGAADDAADNMDEVDDSAGALSGTFGGLLGSFGDTIDSMLNMGDGAVDLSGILSGDLAVGGFLAAADAAGKLVSALWDGMNELGEYGDNIDKSSQKMGISAEAYQEWDAVMQHSGTSIDSMRRGMMQITDAMDELRDASQKTIDTKEIEKARLAYDGAKLSVKEAEEGYKKAVSEHGQYSLEAEKAAQSLKEAQLKASEAWETLNDAANGSSPEIGNAAQAIQNLGIQVTDADGKLRAQEDVFKDVIFALQGIDDEAERAAIAQDIFGRSAMELGPLLNTSAEDTQKMIDRVHELGGVIPDETVKAAAAFEDAKQDFNTAVSGIKHDFEAFILPIGTGAFNLGTDILVGARNFGHDATQFVGGLFDDITGAFNDFIPNALTWGSDLIGNFVDGIKGMWDNAKHVVSDFAGMIKNFLGFSEPKEGPLSNFHTYAPDMMALFAEGIRANEKLITDAVGDVFDIDFTPESARASFAAAPSETYSVERMRANDRPVNVIFELDGVQRWVYRLTKAEEQRVGVKLTGVM